MAVDLRVNNLRYRKSLLVMDDHLLELTHASTRDRMKRIGYDRIDSVIAWRTTAWLPMIGFLLLFGVPAAIFLRFEPIFAFILLIPLLLMEAYYLYAGKFHLRIVRAGTVFQLAGVVPPGKRERFLRVLEAAIRHGQQEAEARALARQAQRRDADAVSALETGHVEMDTASNLEQDDDADTGRDLAPEASPDEDNASPPDPRLAL